MRWTQTVLIEAPADVVWRLTMDVTKWPSFTPTMQRVERLDPGPLRVGSSARIKQPAQRPTVWTVTALEPGQRLTWQTSRIGFTMIGSHLVESVGDRSRNTLTIDLTGPAARPVALVLGPVLRRALRAENLGFKAAAERSAQP
jgi:uncharacterized membrane protein